MQVKWPCAAVPDPTSLLVACASVAGLHAVGMPQFGQRALHICSGRVDGNVRKPVLIVAGYDPPHRPDHTVLPPDRIQRRPALGRSSFPERDDRRE